MKVYHVILRGNRVRCTFGDSNCKIAFIKLLDGIARKYKAHLYAFVVMDTHVHLLIGVSRVSKFVQTLLSRYARIFNKMMHRSGEVFSNASVTYEKEYESWQIDCLFYILNNPIEAGICLYHKDYFWSSYKLHIGSRTRLSNYVTINNSLVIGNFNSIEHFKSVLKDKLKYQESIAHIKYRNR